MCSQGEIVLRYTIIFDESNKLDTTKKFSYYGAYGVEQSKCDQIEKDIKKILDVTGKRVNSTLLNTKMIKILLPIYIVYIIL